MKAEDVVPLIAFGTLIALAVGMFIVAAYGDDWGLNVQFAFPTLRQSS